MVNGVDDALEGVLGVHPDGHREPGTGGLHTRQELVTVYIFSSTKNISDTLNYDMSQQLFVKMMSSCFTWRVIIRSTRDNILTFHYILF